MYHREHDDVHAERTPGGGVLFNVGRGTTVSFSSEEWASLVAKVSKGGDEGGRYFVARDFHGDGSPARPPFRVPVR